MSGISDTHNDAEREQRLRWGVVTSRIAKRAKCGHLSHKRTPDNELCIECVIERERKERRKGAMA